MILADLYNKVLGFFRQTDTEQVESAKETACNRLKVVLMQDRTNLTPELMERMRKEMIELLSKYVEMDKEALELELANDGDQVALMLSIPVIRARDEEEIKATLEAENAKKAPEEETEEESSEDEEIVEKDTDEEVEAETEDVSEDETEESSEEQEEDKKEKK